MSAGRLELANKFDQAYDADQDWQVVALLAEPDPEDPRTGVPADITGATFTGKLWNPETGTVLKVFAVGDGITIGGDQAAPFDSKLGRSPGVGKRIDMDVLQAAWAGFPSGNVGATLRYKLVMVKDGKTSVPIWGDVPYIDNKAPV